MSDERKGIPTRDLAPEEVQRELERCLPELEAALKSIDESSVVRPEVWDLLIAI